MAGKLIVVGTPIGNLSDFSPRAIETLQTCDFIAAEDTRVTVKLLNHFGIKKPMVSYFEHNKMERGDIICNRMEQGRGLCSGIRCRYAGNFRPGRIVGCTMCTAEYPCICSSGSNGCYFCIGGFRTSNRKIYV